MKNLFYLGATAFFAANVVSAQEPLVQASTDPSQSNAVIAPEIPALLASNTDQKPAMLLAGAPIFVILDEEISTINHKVGDSFKVTVLHDVVDQGTVVIPKGTKGLGEVTFRTRKGGFGKPGILGIALRNIDMGGKIIALDGRYREEGGNNTGATVTTWLVVGVFSGFIKGKSGVIPKGRELKARTGEDIGFTLGVSQPAVVIAETQQITTATGIDTNQQAAKPTMAEEAKPVTTNKNSAEIPTSELKTGDLK